MRDSGKNQSRFAGFIKKIGLSLLNSFRGDFPVFLLFLSITFLVWWSQTMSQTFETQVKIPLQITGIPASARVTQPAVTQITAVVSGKGTGLRKAGRKIRNTVLSVPNRSFSMNHGYASCSTQSLRDSLVHLLPPQVSVLTMEPDSLVYLYRTQRDVMLPVEFTGTSESQDQFYLERIEFSPDSVMAKILESDTLEHRAILQLDNIVLASDTTRIVSSIKPIPDVLFPATDVHLTVISQQYTEKSIEVPVTGVNFPPGVTLKSFPSKASLTMWVKMSDYDRVGEQDFQVVVDYNDISQGSDSKATLRIFSQPVGVRNIRLVTRTVDYLMESNQL